MAYERATVRSPQFPDGGQRRWRRSRLPDHVLRVPVRCAPTVYAAFNAADQECWSGTTNGTNCSAPPAGSTTYGYDTTGNQTSDTTTAGISNAFDVFNHLTTTTIGGVTTPYTYTDTSNTERLTAGATSFLTSNLGLTQQTTSGTTISYIRDPYGNLLAMHTGGHSYYYTLDNQNSVIALTDNTGATAATYSYDPWGNQTSATGPQAATNPWRYATGYEGTVTGYLKLGARYYNPTTGRFTQPDPKATYSGYAYGSDNPTNNVDPTGNFSFGISGCIAVVIGICGSISIGTDSDGNLAASASAGPVVGVGEGAFGTYDPGPVPTGGFSDVTAGVCGGGVCGGATFADGGSDIGGFGGVSAGEGLGFFVGPEFGFGI